MKELIEELRGDIYDCGLDCGDGGCNHGYVSSAIETLDNLVELIKPSDTSTTEQFYVNYQFSDEKVNDNGELTESRIIELLNAFREHELNKHK